MKTLLAIILSLSLTATAGAKPRVRYPHSVVFLMQAHQLGIKTFDATMVIAGPDDTADTVMGEVQTPDAFPWMCFAGHPTVSVNGSLLASFACRPKVDLPGAPMIIVRANCYPQKAGDSGSAAADVYSNVEGGELTLAIYCTTAR